MVLILNDLDFSTCTISLWPLHKISLRFTLYTSCITKGLKKRTEPCHSFFQQLFHEGRRSKDLSSFLTILSLFVRSGVKFDNKQIQLCSSTFYPLNVIKVTAHQSHSLLVLSDEFITYSQTVEERKLNRKYFFLCVRRLFVWRFPNNHIIQDEFMMITMCDTSTGSLVSCFLFWRRLIYYA
jgi:hypothetical protein